MFQDFCCCCDYIKILVSSFAHQIQYEYYGGNKSVYIEVVSLEIFSVTTQPEMAYFPESCTFHAFFRYFLSDEIRGDASTTAAHSKHSIELLKQF